jgi:serine/threonine protein kinase
MHEPSRTGLDDELDQLVSEFSDAVARGQRPDLQAFLRRAPERARPGLERAMKMIQAGLSGARPGASPLLPGAMFDHYELVREIGRGGMATVWLARDGKLERPVAIKVLRPALAVEPRHVDRFRREALAIASLEHPHVVQIHGVGESGGHHWLAMEYVDGPALGTVLEALPADRPPTVEDLARATGITALASASTFEQGMARLLAPVAEALASAHAAGIVHRDVKPSNILIRRDGRAVLADFGLAKGDDDPALSLTGEGIGTPYYMSPEQAYLTGKNVDHRTDVYSFGVTLYEALSGRRPFGGASFLEVVESIRSTLPPALRQVRSVCTRDAEAVVRASPENRINKNWNTFIGVSSSS